MKKLGRSITIITFSLFVTSLLVLSGSAPFADSQNPTASPPIEPLALQGGVQLRNPTESSSIPASKAVSPSDSKASLSKKYLDNLLAAELALSRGDLESALANYSWVAKETQDPKISRRATEIALLYGVLANAQDSALLWAKTDPSNLEAKLTAAAILIRAGDLKQALTFFKQIDTLQPTDGDDQFLILYKQLEDPTDRSRIIGLLEQLQTKNAYIALSEIYLFQSETSKALTNSEKAINLDSNNAHAIILYTQSLVGTNQAEKAKSFLDTQLQKQPNNVLLKFFYIQFYEEQGQPNKGYNQLVSLSKMENLSASELFLLSRLSMEGKWLPEAEILLKKLEKLPDQADLAHYFLGRLSELQSQNAKAIEWYQQVENAPFYGVAHIRASLLYNSMNNPTAALQILNTMEVGPEDERPVALAKVETFIAMQDYTKALMLLDTLLQSTPTDLELQNTRAALAKKIAEEAATKGKAPALIKQR